MLPLHNHNSRVFKVLQAGTTCQKSIKETLDYKYKPDLFTANITSTTTRTSTRAATTASTITTNTTTGKI